MPSPDDPPISEDLRRSLDRAGKIAKAVDDAITQAEPAVEDLQVAVNPAGNVVVSGVVRSVEAKANAGRVAGAVPGVKHLINSLTVVNF